MKVPRTFHHAVVSLCNQLIPWKSLSEPVLITLSREALSVTILVGMACPGVAPARSRDLGRGWAQKTSVFRVWQFTEWPWPFHWIAFSLIHRMPDSSHPFLQTSLRPECSAAPHPNLNRERCSNRKESHNEKPTCPFFIAKGTATASVSLPKSQPISRKTTAPVYKNRCVQFGHVNESQTRTTNNRQEMVHSVLPSVYYRILWEMPQPLERCFLAFFLVWRSWHSWTQSQMEAPAVVLLHAAPWTHPLQAHPGPSGSCRQLTFVHTLPPRRHLCLQRSCPDFDPLICLELWA